LLRSLQPNSCACSKLIPLGISSLSPAIVYQFPQYTHKSKTTKSFNSVHKQLPQSARENSFQSNQSQGKKIVSVHNTHNVVQKITQTNQLKSNERRTTRTTTNL
jgi:hypothetical protein